jgi:hypothetical protein
MSAETLTFDNGLQQLCVEGVNPPTSLRTNRTYIFDDTRVLGADVIIYQRPPLLKVGTLAVQDSGCDHHCRSKFTIHRSAKQQQLVNGMLRAWSFASLEGTVYSLMHQLCEQHTVIRRTNSDSTVNKSMKTIRLDTNSITPGPPWHVSVSCESVKEFEGEDSRGGVKK